MSRAELATERVERFLDAREREPRPEAWLYVPPAETLLESARAADAEAGDRLRRPLLGTVFAVKDNLDVAGWPTTAGCPAFSYVPDVSARVVSRLQAAGALPVGKTHMDQFATGLVGTRSPHGPCRNAHDPSVISGGSSSGSAVAVATGCVDFALGTDTAGSGRVPAALNGVFGLKPTRGMLSTRGVVPACPSLDCVSVFAPDGANAADVFAAARAPDPTDPYSRPGTARRNFGESFRFALPPDDVLGQVDAEHRASLSRAAELLHDFGGRRVDVDWEPFRAASRLLYQGPWLAEREAAFGQFVSAHPEAVDPTVRAILEGARAISGADVFRGLHRLQVLRRDAARSFEAFEVLVVPPVTRSYRIQEVLVDPIATNAALGTFNNFVNLLDLCACVTPISAAPGEVPSGVTLCAPAFADDALLEVARRLEAARGPIPLRPAAADRIELVVVGAHLSGMPLHHELEALGARFARALRTEPRYRLHALPGTDPPKPGLVQTARDGVAIEVEVYRLTPEAFGRFVEAIPAPLGIGRIALEDGTRPAGFLCEAVGLESARDVSQYGGWRAFRAAESDGKAPAHGAQNEEMK